MAEEFPGYVALDVVDPEPSSPREFPPPGEHPDGPAPAGSREQRQFKLERWPDITFDAYEEWLVKRILPRSGVAAIYGKPGSFKSFVAFSIGLTVALSRPWAGRRVSGGPVVYIGAEGAAGLRKRKAGYVKAVADLPADIDFILRAAVGRRSHF
jgi:AAA domain